MTGWRKSSYSGGGGSDGQECVELGDLGSAVGVRDSRAPEAGHLAVSRGAFAELLAWLKRDEPTPDA
ncbi:DUF397 domain-containing protein [Actinomadura nitritigenes]|uniref:DUF397 domain-containing protein n=1 Tax=Actinomadura nitritigenes TaxID=134602 RepID=UPI003D8A366E